MSSLALCLEERALWVRGRWMDSWCCIYVALYIYMDILTRIRDLKSDLRGLITSSSAALLPTSCSGLATRIAVFVSGHSLLAGVINTSDAFGCDVLPRCCVHICTHPMRHT